MGTAAWTAFSLDYHTLFYVVSKKYSHSLRLCMGLYLDSAIPCSKLNNQLKIYLLEPRPFQLEMRLLAQRNEDWAQVIHHQL